MSQAPQQCELCQRQAHLTRHHLIPRTLHSRKRIRRQFSRDELHSRILWVCRACHSKIHNTLSEMELALYYHSRERLLSHEDIARFVVWLSGKPAGFKPKGKIRKR